MKILPVTIVILVYLVAVIAILKGCESRSKRSWAAYERACEAHPERFPGQRCAIAALGGE